MTGAWEHLGVLTGDSVDGGSTGTLLLLVHLTLKRAVGSGGWEATVKRFHESEGSLEAR